MVLYGASSPIWSLSALCLPHFSTLEEDLTFPIFGKETDVHTKDKFRKRMQREGMNLRGRGRNKKKKERELEHCFVLKWYLVCFYFNFNHVKFQLTSNTCYLHV